MMNRKVLIVLVAFFVAFSGFSQEGLAPLQRNDVLYNQVGKTLKAEALDNFSYQFLLDTIHLDSLIDDFSKNYFKSYSYDTNSPLIDTLVWVLYEMDGVYEPSLLAMLDTSYT